jgi:vancomycin resistance protein VanJ
LAIWKPTPAGSRATSFERGLIRQPYAPLKLNTRLSTFAWLTALLMVLVWLLTTFVAERSVPTMLLTYFGLPQLWLVLTVPLLLLCLRKRDRRAICGSFSAFALACSLLGFELPGQTKATPSFRLMTYNIARGAGGAEALAKVVKLQAPDVLCLQETNGLQPEMFAELVQRLPGYSLVRSREIVILSRFPVLSEQNQVLPNTTRRLLSARLNVNSQPVTILNVHFTTVLLRQDWTKARDDRNIQLNTVLRQVQTTPGPFLACGDFNTPPRGLIYAQLSQAFTNAFQDAGLGFGYSFPSGSPVVRIDHLWLRGARAVRAFVPDSRASDHRPLVVDVALP